MQKFNMFDKYVSPVDLINTNYSIGIQCLGSITQDLNNFSSSEEQVRAQRITGKIRITANEACAVTAVLIRTRHAGILQGSRQTVRNITGPSSLEGHLGSFLNGEFGYIVLGRIVPKVGINGDHEGVISYSYTPSKQMKKYFVSTEQQEDSPTQGYAILVVFEFELTGITDETLTVHEYREYHFTVSEKNTMKLSF